MLIPLTPLIKTDIPLVIFSEPPTPSLIFQYVKPLAADIWLSVYCLFHPETEEIEELVQPDNDPADTFIMLELTS